MKRISTLRKKDLQTVFLRKYAKSAGYYKKIANIETLRSYLF